MRVPFGPPPNLRCRWTAAGGWGLHSFATAPPCTGCNQVPGPLWQGSCVAVHRPAHQSRPAGELASARLSSLPALEPPRPCLATHPHPQLPPGVLLVASEGLHHSVFRRSVVLLTSHGRWASPAALMPAALRPSVSGPPGGLNQAACAATASCHASPARVLRCRLWRRPCAATRAEPHKPVCPAN